MRSVATALLIAAALALGVLAFLRHGVGRGTDASIEMFLVRLMDVEAMHIEEISMPDLAIHYTHHELQRRGRRYRRILGNSPPPKVSILSETETTDENGARTLHVEARLEFPKGVALGEFTLRSPEGKGWLVHRFEVHIPEELQRQPNRQMLETAAKRLGEFWGGYRGDNMQQVMDPALIARLPLDQLQKLLEKDVETRGVFEGVHNMVIEELEPGVAHARMVLKFANAEVPVRLEFAWQVAMWALTDLAEEP